MWNLGWYPCNDPVSAAQERTERMYEREDEELRREAVHEYEHESLPKERTEDEID